MRNRKHNNFSDLALSIKECCQTLDLQALRG